MKKDNYLELFVVKRGAIFWLHKQVFARWVHVYAADLHHHRFATAGLMLR